MKDYEELEFNEIPEVAIDDISLVGKIIKIFTSPKEAFAIINQNAKLLPIYGIYVLMSILALAIPFLTGNLKETIVQQLQSTGTELTDQLIQLTMVLGLVGALIAILLLPFFTGFIYHIICMIMGKTNIKKTFIIILYSSFIGLFGSFLSTIVLEVTNFTLIFSPLMFIDYESMSAIPIALLSLLDIFAIWNIVVLFIGFKIMHKLSNVQTTILIAVPYTLKVIVIILATLMVESMAII